MNYGIAPLSFHIKSVKNLVLFASSMANVFAVYVLGSTKEKNCSSRLKNSGPFSIGGTVPSLYNTNGLAIWTLSIRWPFRYRRNSKRFVSIKFGKVLRYLLVWSVSSNRDRFSSSGLFASI